MSSWLPLESNPDVLNNYIRKLGVTGDWSFVDVLGLDSYTLGLLPKPVKALILLLPCSDVYEQHRKMQDEKLKETKLQYPTDLFFMKQIIHNACGTIAVVHAIANNNDMTLEDGILKNYLDAARSLTAEERGKLLEDDKLFTELHKSAALDEQSIRNIEGPDHHFITLVQKDGELFELDGRKSFPINHGPTSLETFLTDAARVCKEFMARDAEEIRFTVIAVTPTQH